VWADLGIALIDGIVTTDGGEGTIELLTKVFRGLRKCIKISGDGQKRGATTII